MMLMARTLQDWAHLTLRRWGILTSIAEGLAVSAGLGALAWEMCAISEQVGAAAFERERHAVPLRFERVVEFGKWRFRVSYMHERKNTKDRCGVAVEVG